jgi:ribosomal protein S6E (S10)
LHITGGSDFHGEKVKPDVALAAWELDLDWLL